ncbi:hypothetical protein HYH03_019039 [Edaphochlamys debaryana]|uniref:RING-type domain-containing protein n=1 Tax=Edaphochlamys debaryana TaxID=47281 RepID=A0A835XJ13_9CHLO|nr:hypothetical protein HYH03_019039 [Edaphochlamys debaryana]|eukprot:KAG2482015.1 hypothetical protein HYH03_019039 [Edaphochlamys debaryana]
MEEQEALTGPSGRPPELPFRLLYPVGSRKWNVRSGPNKRADLMGAFHSGQTILATPILHQGASWLAVQLPDGRIGFCKQYDEAHMVQHHNTRTGYGWYRVLYPGLHDEQVFGMGLETLTTELLGQLAAAPPGPPPAPGTPQASAEGGKGGGRTAGGARAGALQVARRVLGWPGGVPALGGAGEGRGSAASAASAVAGLPCPRDRCAACWLPLRAGGMAYVGSCGHSYHFECLKLLGDANICTACGVWYAVGQSPPAACPAPSPTSPFQHVHQVLWFVPPFYRYILIYAAMLLASPLLLLASWLGLLTAPEPPP